MDFHDWSRLPPEVLVTIFRHIPSSDLVLNIPLVCWAWRDTQHHMLQQMPFWWERLEHERIMITRDHREDLINNVNKRKLVKLLKSMLLPEITFTREIFAMEEDFRAFRSWDITSDLVSKASVYLMYRTPRSVSILLEPGRVPDSDDLDILLLQLSHTDCEVNFHDIESCMFKSSLSADSILSYLNRDNVKCKMNRFHGYVTSIDSLPNSIRHLRLAIKRDDYGKAIDPGMSTLQERFTNLRYVGLDVRSGTDLSDIQLLPHYEIDTIND